jgi:hypothetical protein
VPSEPDTGPFGAAVVPPGVCAVMKTNAPAAMAPTRPDVIHPRDRARVRWALGRADGTSSGEV